jgi:RNA polymerase sigma-70 factor (ECF subfamily)
MSQMRRIALFEKAILRPTTQIEAPDAFADLYQAHTYAVFNYCLFRVNDRDIAEDLTADAFERAWRARRRYNPDRGAFNTWLFSIVRHVVADWQRRQARRPLLQLKTGQPSGAPSPELQVETGQEQERLRRLVHGLGPLEQELIALKFGAGLTNREISPLLGKSESAVGSALHRLMKKLRTDMEQN